MRSVTRAVAIATVVIVPISSPADACSPLTDRALHAISDVVVQGLGYFPGETTGSIRPSLLLKGTKRRVYKIRFSTQQQVDEVNCPTWVPIYSSLQSTTYYLVADGKNHFRVLHSSGQERLRD